MTTISIAEMEHLKWTLWRGLQYCSDKMFENNPVLLSLHACSLFWVLFEVTYSKLKPLILNFHVIKQQKSPIPGHDFNAISQALVARSMVSVNQWYLLTNG